jgi:hypothetical protein
MTTLTEFLVTADAEIVLNLSPLEMPQPPTNIQFRITCGDSCEIEEIVQDQSS